MKAGKPPERRILTIPPITGIIFRSRSYTY